MSAATENVEHPTRTRRSSHRYLFVAKHHGGDRKAAMWLPEINRDTEFGVFDRADGQEIADSRGWLYGVLPDADGKLLTIETWDEQMAEFQPGVSADDPWHGYPKWALDELAPANRRRHRSCPERAVFDRMVDAGLITRIERKRLLSGRPV